MHLSIEHMPGPDNARELQLQQCRTAEKIFSTVLHLQETKPGLTTPQAYASPEVVAIQKEYDQTVADLEALLGPEAHCNAVDCERWSTYSDWFKCEHGFRPRMHVTRADATKELRI